MTATLTLNIADTLNDQIQDVDAFVASVLTFLFRGLSGTWTRELRVENATSVNLPTIGHGCRKFTSRETIKINREDDPAEMSKKCCFTKMEIAPAKAVARPLCICPHTLEWEFCMANGPRWLESRYPKASGGETEGEKRRKEGLDLRGKRQTEKGDLPHPVNGSAGRRISDQSA